MLEEVWENKTLENILTSSKGYKEDFTMWEYHSEVLIAMSPTCRTFGIFTNILLWRFSNILFRHNFSYVAVV